MGVEQVLGLKGSPGSGTVDQWHRASVAAGLLALTSADPPSHTFGQRHWTLGGADENHELAMSNHPDGMELFSARLQAGRERAAAVGRQLVGLHLDDARELAARSKCKVRVVRRNGWDSGIRTADLVTWRIDVETRDDIVVACWPR
jgi:hypothetical protein